MVIIIIILIIIIFIVIGNLILKNLTAGNKNGLLVPFTTTDLELQYLRNSLPDCVEIKRVEERLKEISS